MRCLIAVFKCGVPVPALATGRSTKPARFTNVLFPEPNLLSRLQTKTGAETHLSKKLGSWLAERPWLDRVSSLNSMAAPTSPAVRVAGGRGGNVTTFFRVFLVTRPSSLLWALGFLQGSTGMRSPVSVRTPGNGGRGDRDNALEMHTAAVASALHRQGNLTAMRPASPGSSLGLRATGV